MKIGVICEGPSDFPAFRDFLGSELERRGFNAEIRSLFPDLDNTRPEGGWGNLLNWLERNPSALRVQKYFSGGLFGGQLSTDPIDMIVIQLDADVLQDESFRKFVSRNLGLEISDVETASDKAAQITQVLLVASEFEQMAEVDRNRHVLAAVVEATETWCVAAFNNELREWETLKGDDLVTEFMKALEGSEGRPIKEVYSVCDKNPARRESFCSIHKVNSDRIVTTCPQFREVIEKLLPPAT